MYIAGRALTAGGSVPAPQTSRGIRCANIKLRYRPGVAELSAWTMSLTSAPGRMPLICLEVPLNVVPEPCVNPSSAQKVRMGFAPADDVQLMVTDPCPALHTGALTCAEKGPGADG